MSALLPSRGLSVCVGIETVGQNLRIECLNELGSVGTRQVFSMLFSLSALSVYSTPAACCEILREKAIA